MAVKKATEVAKTPAKEAVAVTNASLPEGMSEAQANAMAAKALGQISSEGMIVPRVKLLQAQSNEVTAEQGQAGNFYNSVSSEQYGKNINVVVLMPIHMRLRMEMGKGLLCRSIENTGQAMVGRGDPGIACAACPYGKWDEKEPPKCNEGYQYFVLVVNEEGYPIEDSPMAVSFMSSSMKEAKKWNTLLKYLGKGVYPWQVMYTITTEKQQNEKGTFYIPKVNKTGKLAPQETVQLAWEFVPGLIAAAEKDSLNVAADEGSNVVQGSVSTDGTEDDLPY